MDMTGEHRIAAPRTVVWDALNNPEVLKACIPGCEDLVKTSDTELQATVVQKIGPVKAKFEGAVELANINAPESYTIQGEGSGGVAGFAKGGADVHLTEDGNETVLRYTVHATVGGKLARLGSRLIDSTAKKLAGQFFDNFQSQITDHSASAAAPASAGARAAARVRKADREEPMANLNVTVNGKAVSRNVPDTMLLSEFLREELRLTGTHVGCDTSQCGACVVHVDGKAVKSCTALAVSLDGTSVTTVEGLANGGDLHPMQAAFKEHHGLQCGFCTPGMIMSGIDIVQRAQAEGRTLTEATIRNELEGNICRCTGYHNIVKAIEDAAGQMTAPAQAAE